MLHMLVVNVFNVNLSTLHSQLLLCHCEKLKSLFLSDLVRNVVTKTTIGFCMMMIHIKE